MAGWQEAHLACKNLCQLKNNCPQSSQTDRISLTLDNDLQSTVSHSHDLLTKDQCHRSVGSKARVDTNGQTDRWTKTITLLDSLMHLVIIPKVLYRNRPWVLWHGWLGDRKSIWPVKNWAVRCGVTICLKQGASDLHMVQLMPQSPHHPEWLVIFLESV